MTEPAKKRGRGRPSKFDQLTEATAAELNIAAVKRCARIGFTTAETCEALEISENTLKRWRIAHPELRQALKLGRAYPNDNVERALYERAIGYRRLKEVIGPQGEKIKLVEEVPPDVTACIFWLKNRRRDKWTTESDNVAGQAFAMMEQLVRMATARMIDGQARESGDGRDHGDGARVDPVAALLRAPSAAGNT